MSFKKEMFLKHFNVEREKNVHDHHVCLDFRRKEEQGVKDIVAAWQIIITQDFIHG